VSLAATIVIPVSEDERKEKAARLRHMLERYRGGRFETGSSGGAGGMMFFRDANDALFYIGGFNTSDAYQITMVLNLVLQLMERRKSVPPASSEAERPG
jgi:hypothetical protein